MIDENGVELREFSDAVYEAFAGAAQAVFEETRAHSELAARIDDSFQAALREIGYWMQISDIAYSTKRNKALGLT
jgi:TRAP-type mannitol/chloroaromatic compound transport system substrate-binding protein